MPLSNSRHGSHAKLRTLLFFMQRCLTHTTLVPLQQLDTIKRSLQVRSISMSPAVHRRDRTHTSLSAAAEPGRDVDRF